MTSYLFEEQEFDTDVELSNPLEVVYTDETDGTVYYKATLVLYDKAVVCNIVTEEDRQRVEDADEVLFYLWEDYARNNIPGFVCFKMFSNSETYGHFFRHGK